MTPFVSELEIEDVCLDISSSIYLHVCNVFQLKLETSYTK